MGQSRALFCSNRFNSQVKGSTLGGSCPSWGTSGPDLILAVCYCCTLRGLTLAVHEMQVVLLHS